MDILKKALAPLGRLGHVLALVLLAMIAFSCGRHAHADPLTIKVIGADPAGNLREIKDFRWTIERDVSKASVPGAHATRDNYSFSFHSSYMPVVAAGKMTSAGPMIGNDCTEQASVACLDPDRKYMAPPALDPAQRYYISVLPEDGYSMGGTAIPAGAGSVTVYVNKYPLPAAQLSIFVFNDNSPLNAAPDLPQEQGLAGFTILLTEAGGTYGASGGQVTQDAFGNPLGTVYKTTCTGTETLTAGYCYSGGKPIVLTRGSGIITSGVNGIAVIRNLFPAKYTVQVIPPTGSDWHQTTTIEGTKGDDAWVKNGEPPFFQEFGPPGHHVFTGFTHSGVLARNGNTPVLNGTATITGKIVSIHNSRPPDYSFHDGAAFPGCWVGLNEATGSRRALYAAACNADSTFSIPKVPAGTWELVVWDDAQDVIIATAPVTVAATDTTKALGNVPVFNWFARYEGRVFFDSNGDGFPDAGETGIPNQAMNIRFRDGSIYQSALTDSKGEFKFNELFPFFNWMIGEVDYSRFKATGATIVVDAGGAVPAHNGWTTPSFNKLTPQVYTCTQDDVAANTAGSANLCSADGQPMPYRVEHGVVLLEGTQTFLGQTNHIEWGKKSYTGQENGGIAGIVEYGITRAEDDPKNATAENWEPGIPRVQVNLYLDCDNDGKADKPSALADGTCAAPAVDLLPTLSAQGYKYDPPDVDNYPFCWRDPASCGLTVAQKGPEDVKRSKSGAADEFSYGDVFRWGHDPENGNLPYVGLGKTDGWDDALPTDCPGEPYKVPYGADAGKPLDCYDGLRNWNQARPAVFDGGYAFGSVAGQDNLPNKKYIVEAVAPPGYFHQGNGDKNVVFGDQVSPSPLAEPYVCAGQDLPIPAVLTLFPGQAQPNPMYKEGKTWKKCDMKLVDMQPGRNPAPNFFLYTEAPVAGHGVGFILDDLSSEFDVNAPTFGEKHAPPHLPVSLSDWTGREIGRVYADEFGSFNFLVPSTFTINPPFPSGVSPNMITSCMNSPGPIPDPSGATNPDGSPKMVIDPFFNRSYSQFCYTFQYLPGKTTYLDTPVVPVAAFVGPAQNPLDCEFGDGTPVIYSVTGNGNSGPWVPASGNRTLTIVSAGNVDVLNPYYEPSAGGSARLIKRDFGFGAAGADSKVLLGDIELPVTSWSDGVIVATVPKGAATGQLSVVRAGTRSPVGLTVTVGGSAPKYVAAGGSIQAVIDAPDTNDGDLVIVPPGIYNTPLIMDKKIQLQGWGAMSTMINAAKVDSNTLKKWRTLIDRKIDARPASPVVIDPDTGVNTLNAGPNRTFDLLPGQSLGGNLSENEPILFGAEEAPGVLVVGKAAANGSGNGHFNGNNPARIDGLTITGADGGGGILVSGYGRNVQIANNRIVGNSGTYTGGIRVGHVDLMDATNTAYGGYTDSVDPNVNIHHNWVVQNGSTEAGAGGGIGIGNGASSYQVVSNYVCGNFTLGNGGGIGQLGLASGGTIANNSIIFNQNFNQSASTTGGGVFISGPAPVNAAARSAGAGSVSLVQNLIQGNNSGAGAGGGVRLAQINGLDVERAPNNDATWNSVTMVNNIIVDNVAGFAGGGVSIVDALRVNASNNTIAFNDSTATSQEAFANAGDPQSSPQPVGLVSHRTSDGLLSALTTSARRNLYRFSNPVLANNILWHNRAGCWAITGSGAGEFGLFDPTSAGACNLSSPMGTNPVYIDLAVVGTAAQGTFANKYAGANEDKLNPDHSILSELLDGYNKNGNQSAVPQFVAEYVNGDRKPMPFIPGFSTTIDTAATSDEGGNFIDVRYGPLTPWNCTATGGAVKSPQNAANCPLFGNYHLKPGSPAIDAGLARTGSNGVPATDVDGDARTANKIDIGADELSSGSTTPPPDQTVPVLGVLDTFDRGNANTLGGNWNQGVLFGVASLRVNNQQSVAGLPGLAFWGGSFGAKQAAAMRFSTAPVNGAALLLKASGNFVLGSYPSYVRVRYNNGAILADTTSNGLSFANQVTVSGNTTLAAGDTLVAQCDADGTVKVWQVRGSSTSFLGSGTLPASSPAGAAAGRIGLTLPLNARIDDFAGGTVP